jgi:hypothetical protein
VTVQHAVAGRVDEITADLDVGYQSLSDMQRIDRLKHCLGYVALDDLEYGELPDALIRLIAEAQAWCEALMAEAAR